MSTMPPVSVTDKVREYIADGRIKDGINELLKNLKALSLSEPFFYQTRNDILQLSSNIARLDREKRNKLIDYKEYNFQCNHISNSVLGLLEGLDAEIKNAFPDHPLSGAGSLYKVELVLDMDFENSTDKEIQAVLDRIGNILRTKPNELKIIAKRRGSIVVELQLSAETLVRLKSLAKIGVVEKVKDVKAVGKDWGWMDDGELKLVLNRVILHRADLSGADLSGADLSGADLSGADLSGADLSGADLSVANLRGASLIRSDLSGTYLSGADFSGGNLLGTDLNEADLSNANLCDTNLSNANFRDADLRGVNFLGVNLLGVNLVGVNFLGVNLRGANLSGVNLSGVNLSGANLSETYLSSADLSNADLSNADLSGADLSDADLSDADLSGADLSGADFIGADLNTASLIRTIFHEKHRELLKLMDVDISRVIFVDDYELKERYWEQAD